MLFSSARPTYIAVNVKKTHDHQYVRRRVARFGKDVISTQQPNAHAHGSIMFRTTNILHIPRGLRPCIHPPSRSLVHSLPRNFPRIGRITPDKSELQSSLPTFSDQVARSTEVESFSSRVRPPTIRNQVLVSKLQSSFHLFVLQLAHGCSVLYWWIFTCIFDSGKSNPSRHRLLVTTTRVGLP